MTLEYTNAAETAAEIVRISKDHGSSPSVDVHSKRTIEGKTEYRTVVTFYPIQQNFTLTAYSKGPRGGISYGSFALSYEEVAQIHERAKLLNHTLTKIGFWDPQNSNSFMYREPEPAKEG